jgi:hypothetical protein
MHKPNTEQFEKLFKEDAVWGEQEVIKFRWVLISIILILLDTSIIQEKQTGR